MPADDVTRQVGTWRGFHVSATRTGHEPFTDTTVSEVEADLDVGRGLGVPTGTPVLRRARRQGIVGAPPVQLSTSYLRLDLVDKIPVLREVDTGPGGMYSRMEELGHRVHFEESVTCPASPRRRAAEVGDRHESAGAGALAPGL